MEKTTVFTVWGICTPDKAFSLSFIFFPANSYSAFAICQALWQGPSVKKTQSLPRSELPLSTSPRLS